MEKAILYVSIPIDLNSICLAGDINVAIKKYLSEYTGTVPSIEERCFLAVNDAVKVSTSRG